jgi:predicted nucleic acid-binding protein
MRLLVDTSRYSDFTRGDPEVVENIRNATDLAFAFVTIAELNEGYRNGNRRALNEAQLREFISTQQVSILYADSSTVELFADLAYQLARKGRRIPDHDIWIAALALQHNLTLYARDRHFDALPQLQRL